MNNLYVWALAQNLPVGGFGWVKNTSQFNGGTIKIVIKNYNLDSFTRLHNDLSFLPERMKIEKFEKKLFSNIHDRKECLVHIKTLKQAQNIGFLLEKTLRAIKLHWCEYRAKKKIKKMTLKNAFLSWWIIHFLEKPWKR